MNKLNAAIAKINSMPGRKYIAKKFDNTQRIWVNILPNTSSTTGTIYCIDLNGNILASISHNAGLTSNYKPDIIAIDDYVIGLNTASSNYYNLKIYLLTNNGNNYSLSLLRTVSGTKTPRIRYLSVETMFACKHKVNSTTTHYYFTFTALSSRNCPYLYNITTNTLTSTQNSSYDTYALYFHCSISDYSLNYPKCWMGIVWGIANLTYSNKIHYIFTAPGSKPTILYDPILPGTENLSGNCTMYPIFDYEQNNLENLKYEIYANNLSWSGTGRKYTNLLNVGRVSINGGSDCIGQGEAPYLNRVSRGFIDFYTQGSTVTDGMYQNSAPLILKDDDGVLKIYCVNFTSATTSNIELYYYFNMNDEKNKIATFREGQYKYNPNLDGSISDNQSFSYSYTIGTFGGNVVNQSDYFDGYNSHTVKFYDMCNSIKLKKYVKYDWENIYEINLDNEDYYKFTGDTITYRGQRCYVWYRYDGDSLADQDYEYKLLTNSLNLTLPFTTNSPEYVGTVKYNNLTYNDNQIKLDENYDDELPDGFNGLCVMEYGY